MDYWPVPPDGVRDKRYDWTSGDLDYLGISIVEKASTSAGQLWWVKKFTWVAGKVTRVQGPLAGNWDNRATLGW